MKAIEFWAPAILCAVLSLGVIISILEFLEGSFMFPFLAFIPLCFYMVGVVMRKMNKEIVQLREQIETLEKNQR